jgi:hypothetical protein
MSKIFLSINYTGMEEKSFRIANKYAAKLISEGHIVFSPISHSHPIAKEVRTANMYWRPVYFENVEDE